MSLFDRHDQRHEDQEDVKVRDPALVEAAPESYGERTTTDVRTTSAGPLPVRRVLLEQLRNYPRLRDLVLGYLAVKASMAYYDQVMGDLDDAEGRLNHKFWAKLHQQLWAGALPAEFPDSLRTEAQFEALVTTLEKEHTNLRREALAGRKPHQSAQSFPVAYDAVSAMVEAAPPLASLFEQQARKLLNDVYYAVSKIFDEEQMLPSNIGATERETGPSLAEAVDRLAPTERAVSEKQLVGDAPAPARDFETHLFTKRGAA